MLTWDAVNCIAPITAPELAGALWRREGGRRGFSHLLLFNIPQGLCVHHVSYSATQPFLYKAILKASATSRPLHSSHRRKAGKQRKGRLAGKGGTVGICQ